MMRWDIINHFIKKNGYKSYLEIGYYKGWSFDRVECAMKVAVDPNPCKDKRQADIKIGSRFIISDTEKTEVIYKMTSNEFFKEEEDCKFDIIFIDGLHEADQVTKDIQNSLKHLNEGGVIIMHDCNPPKYEHTTTGIDGCWTGDVYKSAIMLRFGHGILGDFHTIDTDWGVGIYKPYKYEPDRTYHNGDGTVNGQEFFDNTFHPHRKELLNLISVEEFKQREHYEPAA